jgi:ABC-type multidrug transport system ATPase subunit
VTKALSVARLTAASPDGTRLTDNVSFDVAPGTLLAIAGPTGAGKTSLAGAIAGAVAVASGNVTVGGREVTDLDPSRRGIGYVAQEDALHGELSVRRTLDDAARLRLPGSSTEERQRRVAAVLAETRLSAQADLAVQRLSVGQRKRVSIATELLSSPAVLVLDEPTASLDPGYEASVFATLRSLADSGRCVIVVTHSLQVISDCDQVALLATGGRLAYLGSPRDAFERFGASSAAELFTALDDDSSPRPFLTPARTRRTRSAPAARGERVSRLRQLRTLAPRYVAVIVADRRRALLYAVQGIVLGLLLLTFVEPHGLRRLSDPLKTVPLSAVGMAVLLVTCVTWLGMANSIREIVKERRILMRERRAGLSSVAYVGSKLAVLGPLVAVQAAVVTVVAIQRQRLSATGAVLPSGVVELSIDLALAGICAVTLALFISAVVRSADKALAVLPLVIVVEFVLSGLRSAVGVPGLDYLRDAASTRWAVQAVEATVTGNPHAWVTAVLAMLALSAAAVLGTFIAVRCSLRLPRVRVRLLPAVGASLAGGLRPNPEMARLARVGASCLAAVAMLVAGARLAAPAVAAPTAPVVSTSTSHVSH